MQKYYQVEMSWKLESQMEENAVPLKCRRNNKSTTEKTLKIPEDKDKRNDEMKRKNRRNSGQKYNSDTPKTKKQEARKLRLPCPCRKKYGRTLEITHETISCSRILAPKML